MFQKLLVVSSVVFSVAAIGGTLVFTEDPVSPDVLETRRQAQAWTTQALGSYQRTENGTVSFHNGISTRVASAKSPSAEDRQLLVALVSGETK
ncbi:MAG: hypothetical protein M3O62_12545 [Pseudomonadota bacterium]|nr:hypothetical protein [Pseudomonadota bacterium]